MCFKHLLSVDSQKGNLVSVVYLGLSAIQCSLISGFHVTVEFGRNVVDRNPRLTDAQRNQSLANLPQLPAQMAFQEII